MINKNQHTLINEKIRKNINQQHHTGRYYEFITIETKMKTSTDIFLAVFVQQLAQENKWGCKVKNQ